MTYLLLLIALSMAAIALTSAGTSWAQQLRRERETELTHRGRAVVAAILHYRAATPPGMSRSPAGWAELLEDRRGAAVLHHLRRVPVDPFTGRADWIELRDAAGGLRGVRSRARVPALRTIGVATGAVDPREATVGDWSFDAGPLPGLRAKETERDR